jgi:excisionase family DNA binding protein
MRQACRLTNVSNGTKERTTVMDAPEVLAVPINEAARRLSLSPRTVATLIAKRELRSVKVGRRRLVPLKALQDFLRRDHNPIAPPSASNK